MNIRFLLSGMSMLLFAACAHHLPAVDGRWQQASVSENFEASGRLALQADGKGYYAQFDWLRTDMIQSLSVNLPIGGSIGRLCADSGGAQLTLFDGQTHRAADLDTLGTSLLGGRHLPLSHLEHWVNGRAVPGEMYELTDEGYLKQLGWTIQRHTDENGYPRLLLVERPQIRLRLVIGRFAVPVGAPESCAAVSS